MAAETVALFSLRVFGVRLFLQLLQYARRANDQDPD